MLGKLLTNATSSTMVPIVKIAITFVMAPVVVQALGDYDYGVWEIVFAIVGYMGIMDLGLTPAIVRHVSRSRSLQDKKKLQKIYSTSLVFFLPLGLLLSLAVFLSSFWAPYIFKDGSGGSVLKYIVFLCIVAIQVFFIFLGSLYSSHLEGYQKYTIRNCTTIVFSLAGAAVIYPLLKSGGGLLVLAAVNTAGYSLKVILYGFLLRRSTYGGYRFQKENVNLQTFKELFDFGLKSFVYSTLFCIGATISTMLIGFFLGPVAVTYYVIPVNLLNHVRNLVWSATRVFMPVFSELDAMQEQGKAKELLINASRYALGVIIPLLTGVFIVGDDFIHHWMGVKYAEQGQNVLQIITLAFLLQWLCPFRNRFLMALGRHGVQIKWSVIGVAVTLCTSLILIPMAGIEGAAAAVLIAALLTEPLLLSATCLAAGLPVSLYVKKVFLPLLVPVTSFYLIVSGLFFYVQPVSIIGVVGLAFCCALLYLPLFYVFVINRAEKAVIINKLSLISRP